MKTKDVVLGVVGGLAAGAVLGILFAPDNGANTRKKIAKKTNKLKDNAQEGFNDLLSTIEDKYKNLTSKVENNVHNSKEKIEKVL